MHHFKPIGEFKVELQSRNAQFGSKLVISCPVWPWHLMDDLENNKAHLLCYFKLCKSFQSHRWIKTIGHLFYATPRFGHYFIAIGEFKLELQSEKSQFGSKSIIFFPVTLKFDRWPWKIIGHLFYETSNFMHHFLAICEFKLEIQSENAQFGSKSTIFLAVWPWNLTDHLENQ